MILETTKTAEAVAKLMHALGVEAEALSGGSLVVTSPNTGDVIAHVHETKDAKAAIDAAHEAFLKWRSIPAPKRGELVASIRRGVARPQTGTRQAGLAGSRQDHLGRPGRSQEMIDNLRFPPSVCRVNSTA